MLGKHHGLAQNSLPVLAATETSEKQAGQEVRTKPGRKREVTVKSLEMERGVEPLLLLDETSQLKVQTSD